METVTSRIEAFRREYPGIELMAVTKFQSAEAAREAIAAGCDLIGESRVQEADGKFPSLPPCRRALIGHLQKNKVKDAVRLFDIVSSVDSLPLAELLSAEALKQNKRIEIYLEANIAAEPQKYGFTTQGLPEAAAHIRTLPSLTLTGLLVMGRASAPETELFDTFSTGKRLADSLDLPVYSAGMSTDHHIAIRAGATQVRLGSSLFR